MNPFGEFILSPGAILAWLAVGLGAGWLAGVVMNGTDFGVMLNLVVGVIGGVLGGAAFGFLVDSDVFWGSLVAPFIGASLLITGVRFLGIGVADAPRGRPVSQKVLSVAAEDYDGEKPRQKGPDSSG